MKFAPSNLFSLEGKVAAVIGGSGTLGSVFCRALGSAGAKVAVIGRSEEKAGTVAKSLAEEGIQAIGIAADATRKDRLEAACDAIVEQFGRVDILVNAPGVNSSTPFFEITEDEWQHIMDSNLKSVFLACQVFGRRMIDQGEGGSIINISSASSGPPPLESLHLRRIQGGAQQPDPVARPRVGAIQDPCERPCTRLLPRRAKPEDPISRGVADILRHTPMGRMGEPEELAGTIIWLASDAASGFVTGALIRVDGGFSAMTI